MYNVVKYGAIGDGTHDDSSAIQAVLDGGHKDIFFPAGKYRLTQTLRVDSFTSIVANPDARLIVCGETDHDANSFLLTNRDHVSGNTSIRISGGIWDGNKQGRTNFKDPDLFNTKACTGTVLNFCNMRDLKLSNFIVANSVVYFVRMCMIEDFEIRNIGFQSEVIENNQDGLHFNGFVKNGVVENIRALTKGQTNDDLIALNADDCMTRSENTGMVCGPIENINIDGLKVWCSAPGKRKSLIDCETRVRNFVIRNFVRDDSADLAPEIATLIIDKTPGMRVLAKSGEKTLLDQTSSDEQITLQKTFSELELG